jgi:PAS domain S-box-containing protein
MSDVLPPVAARIFESITEPIVILDRGLRYLFANDEALELLGKSRTELLGHYIWDVFPEAASNFRETIDRAMETGEATHLVSLDERRDIWFEVHNYPWDEGLAIIFRDVTDKRRSEEARRRAEEQLAFLAEAGRLLGSSLDYNETLRNVAELMVPRLADWCAIDIFDESGTLRRVTVANVSAERAQWVMEKGREYPSDPEKPHSMAHVATTGRPVLVPHVTEEVLQANAQNEEHLETLRQIGFRSLMGVPLMLREASVGAIMMVWAETENVYGEADLRFAEELASRAAIAIENARLYRDARRAEAGLRALNETLEERVRVRTDALARAVTELEERNRALEDFAYVASHDLKEPLRKISTFADLLLKEGEIEPDVERSKYVARIGEASRRMARLIDNLLAYSRVSTEAQPFEPVDLGAVVAGVLTDLEVSLHESGGRVEVDALPTVVADPTQMQQLFMNLIGNALKFRRPGVAPVVQVRMDDAPAGSEDSTLSIEVRDNGIGFDPKHVQRIFSPFKRLHTPDDYPGSGVGLAICKRIVERHGGSIEAKSELGVGSTFTVKLPAAQSVAA